MRGKGFMTHDRAKFIGGSDVAAILGLSQWGTPLTVFYGKTGQTDPTKKENDPQRERILRRGKLMEPVVVQMIKAEYPQLKITKVSTEKKPNRYFDGFMAAEIDFEWKMTKEMIDLFPVLKDIPIGSTQNSEIKTVHPFAASIWGEADTDQIPIAYGAQGMHGLGVTRRQVCLFWVLVGSDNLVPYVLLSDDEIIKSMREKLESFWYNHVLTNILPAPIELLDVYRMLRRTHDIVLQADGETRQLVDELVAVTGEKKSIDEHIEDIKYRLGVKILGVEGVEQKTMEAKHRIMQGAEQLLTINLQGRTTVNTERLRNNYPDAFEECSGKTTYYVYRPKRQK